MATEQLSVDRAGVVILPGGAFSYQTVIRQALPCSVTVAGETCPIDTDWQIGV